MDKTIILCSGKTAAADFARTYLSEAGFEVTQQPQTGIRHLLLDVPSFREDGLLRCGGDPVQLLKSLPKDITIWGGNLNHPMLSGFQTVDFLKDPVYLARNAYITAECALDVTLPRYPRLIRGSRVLILGWGRIGKCLAHLLHALGANVTVAARKETDRAMISALGYHPADTQNIRNALSDFDLIYNTVPAPVLSLEDTACCRPDCLKIDLASKPGIEGEDILTARGLPGIHRPEASGNLIAETMLRSLIKEETS